MTHPTTISAIMETNAIPLSFHGDRWLYAVNLAGLTTLTYMAVGFVYWQLCAIICNRKWDRWNHPATLYRAAWACAGIALTLRSGTEAAYLWAWNSSDVSTGTAILRAKWALTAFSFVFSIAWLGLNVLTYATIITQLRSKPLPVKVWAKLPALRRPLIVAAISIVMSLGSVWLRG